MFSRKNKKLKLHNHLVKRSRLYSRNNNEEFHEIKFNVPKMKYLQLVTDISFDGIEKIENFYAELTHLYLKKDEDMMKVVNKAKAYISIQSQNERKKILKDFKKGNNLLKQFKIVDENEKKQLFDLIESEVDINILYDKK
jgi:hypothetical protein